MSAATERSQQTIVLPASCDSYLSVVCLSVVFVMDKNLNLSAVQSPIELKLGGDLGLVSQMNALVSNLDRFSFCKQTNKQKKLPKSQKTRF